MTRDQRRHLKLDFLVAGICVLVFWGGLIGGIAWLVGE